MTNFSSIDRANLDLAGNLTSQPKTAIPINIPLPKLQPKPDGSPAAISPGEAAIMKQEQAANQQWLQNQRQEQAAREAEIFKREQAARDALRQRLSPADPPPTEPRITNRNPSWEQPTPTSKNPVQPNTPSPAAPPVTPNTSGARLNKPNIDPTSPPASAALMEAAPPVASPKTPPSGLPQAAGLGKYSLPAVGAGIDAASRLIAGQPPLQAGFGASGNFAGSLAGAALGAGFGPVGMFVGGMVGGFVGGAIADLIYNAAFPPRAELPGQPYEGFPPFYGGQENTAYRWNLSTDRNPRSAALGNLVFSTVGPISNYRVTGLINTDTVNGQKIGNWSAEFTNGNGQVVTGSAVGLYPDDLPQLVVQRVDGQPDPRNPPAPAPPIDTRTPSSYFHPGNQEYSPPRGTPAAGQNPAPNNYAPGGTPAGSSPRGDSPNWVPHGGLAPRQNPNPTTTPSNLGGGLPFAEPEQAQKPESPANQAYPQTGTFVSPFSTPSPKPANFGDSNVEPIPIGRGSKLATIPSLPKTSPSKPIPDASSPTPKNQDPLAPTPTTPNPDLDDLREQVKKIGEGLAIITLMLKNPVPPVTKDDIQTAVCEIAQPQGCLGAPIKKAEDAANANGSKLDQLNTLLSGLNLTGTAGLNSKLDIINNKLGEQLPGGIGGKLTRISKWLHLDRILNVLIWWQTLHNAYMLSNNLGQTLFGTVENLLNIFGIKDAEGEDIDVNEYIKNGIDSLAKTVLGVATWEGIKKEWKRYNRIYQAAANIINSVTSIYYSLFSVLEVIGNRISRIGNALRWYGVVADKAYSWMNDNNIFNNPILVGLEKANDTADSIEMVTGEVLNVKEQSKELKEHKTEFLKAIKNGEDKEDKKEDSEINKIKTPSDVTADE